MNRQTIEDRLGYRFQAPALLGQALTHRSFGTPHNERLSGGIGGSAVCRAAGPQGVTQSSGLLLQGFPGCR